MAAQERGKGRGKEERPGWGPYSYMVFHSPPCVVLDARRQMWFERCHGCIQDVKCSEMFHFAIRESLPSNWSSCFESICSVILYGDRSVFQTNICFSVYLQTTEFHVSELLLTCFVKCVIELGTVEISSILSDKYNMSLSVTCHTGVFAREISQKQ